MDMGITPTNIPERIKGYLESFDTELIQLGTNLLAEYYHQDEIIKILHEYTQQGLGLGSGVWGPRFRWRIIDMEDGTKFIEIYKPGYSGYSGRAGVSGYSGYSGFSGYIGTSRVNRNLVQTGPQGWSGYNGTTITINKPTTKKNKIFNFINNVIKRKKANI